MRVVAVLDEADTLGIAHLDLRRARADLFLSRHRDALEINDNLTASVYRHLAREYDSDGSIRDTLFAEATSSLRSNPPGARLCIFRQQEQAELLARGQYRIVSVPIHHDISVFKHGQWMLRVVRGAGIYRPGDLIEGISNNHPEGVVLVSKDAGSIRKLDRLVSVDGKRVHSQYDIERLMSFAASGDDPQTARRFLFHREGVDFVVEAASLQKMGIVVCELRTLTETAGGRWSGG